MVLFALIFVAGGSGDMTLPEVASILLWAYTGAKETEKCGADFFVVVHCGGGGDTASTAIVDLLWANRVSWMSFLLVKLTTSGFKSPWISC